ncbi:MAG: LysR family transcriptional regulator [Asticcacaulis sp.]
MLNFRQIEIFRAIMIAKTVSGAAELLNVAQPGLSRMLRYMEDRLGYSLFDRSSGRLVPTQEALVLFEEIQHIYRGIEDLDQIARRLARGEDRILRLGASPSLGHTIVPGILKQLTRAHPGVNIQFEILSRDQVTDYLVLQRGEYSLTVFEVRHPNIRSQQVASGRMVAAVPVDHPLAVRDSVSIADFQGERLISFRSDIPHGQIIARMHAEAGLPLDIATFVRYAETALSFVENDMGVAFIDSFTARRAMTDRARLLPLAEVAEVPVYLSRSSEMARSVISDSFVEAVQAGLIASGAKMVV